MSDFAKQVMIQIKKIPKGKVATYGQIAALAGKPHGARGVAWILHACSTKHGLPWHRVLNAKGKISFSPEATSYLKQKRRLEKEGVRFSAGDQLDLKKFQWKKKPRLAKHSKTPSKRPRMFGAS